MKLDLSASAGPKKPPGYGRGLERGPVVVGKGGQVNGGERASRVGIANPYQPAGRGQLEGVEMGK
jgi:hypothetical protein